MPAPASARMSVEEFLDWAERQPGRYELVDGEVVAMAPERLSHTGLKGEIYARLRESIRTERLPCGAFVDGVGVRVTENTVYIPDVLVRCGSPLTGDPTIVPDPVIVVEVLSPSTQMVDLGAKLASYLRLETVRHYVLADIGQKLLIHHERTAAGQIVTHIVRDGTLRFDPPGIGLSNLFEG
jgi:Uma2 family endonuclease